MDRTAADRAATAVGASTAAIGVALATLPRRAGPVIGLTTPGVARLTGVVDFVVAAGLLWGRPRWPWLAARATLNLPTAALSLVSARGTTSAGRARAFAMVVSTATIGDVLAARTLRRTEGPQPGN